MGIDLPVSGLKGRGLPTGAPYSGAQLSTANLTRRSLSTVAVRGPLLTSKRTGSRSASSPGHG